MPKPLAAIVFPLLASRSFFMDGAEECTARKGGRKLMNINIINC